MVLNGTFSVQQTICVNGKDFIIESDNSVLDGIEEVGSCKLKIG
jgi:hypothetical protein